MSEPPTPPTRTREYALAANETGAIGEAIVAESARRVDAPNPLRAFARTDLGLDDETAIEVRPDPDAHLQRVPGPDGPLEWRPDFEVAVRVREQSGWRHATTYLVEVKTGRYADFEREQRAVMGQLAERGFDVLLVTVELDAMPDGYGLRVRRIRAGVV